MSTQSYATSKSSDSSHPAALDRRWLRRLNTEQGFREQRQGGPTQGVYDPADNRLPDYNTAGLGPEAQYGGDQPQPSQPGQDQGAYQASRYQAAAAATATASSTSQSAPSPHSADSPRAPALGQQHLDQSHQSLQPSLSPPEQTHQYPQHNQRSQPLQTRNFSQLEDHSGQHHMSSNGTSPGQKLKSVSANRQSVHSGAGLLPGLPQSQTTPSFTTTATHGQQSRDAQQQAAEIGRAMPQAAEMALDMSQEDTAKLIKDHEELRDKYIKVKGYFFEKDEQVKQLQNSLAHQKLAHSRTSLDDSEYQRRFDRLNGLISQLAFSIRKGWKTVPAWLYSAVNKDAVATGKQEMTATGRAFLSHWLVEDLFDRYFHPDLDIALSEQLKMVQRNIRLFAPPSPTKEDAEFLTAKVVAWRLTTVEGLQEVLRSSESEVRRQTLKELLIKRLVDSILQHLHPQDPGDTAAIQGGVEMIIDLAVNMAVHPPLESRDVQIEYFMPGALISAETMKSESGIPALSMSIGDDAAERTSLKSTTSDLTDAAEASANGQVSAQQQQQQQQQQQRPPQGKRSMLSALTGSRKAHVVSQQSKQHLSGGPSSTSLGRPESSSGLKEEAPPRVRMAVGIGAQIRGKTVLVKAPVFST